MDKSWMIGLALVVSGAVPIIYQYYLNRKK